MYEGYGQGRCNCVFTKAYPYAFGPRFGATYKLDEKTVLRGGWGITYGAVSNWWYVTGGSSTLGVGFNSVDWTNPAFGEAALLLRDGLQLQPVAPVCRVVRSRHQAVARSARRAAGMGRANQSSGRRQAGARQPMERQPSARSAQQDDCRSVVRRQPRPRAGGEQPHQLQRDAVGAIHGARPRSQQRRRPATVDVADRFSARGVARVRQAVSQFPWQRDRRTESAAVSAIQRWARGALGAAGADVVRRAASQRHQAAMA